MKAKTLTTTVLMSAALAVGALSASASAALAIGVVNPGQYVLGGFRGICLKSDGTWYGTDYHFSGHWINKPGADDRAALFGNYQYVGSYYGYMNDTITIEGATADWYDYSDDGVYQTFLSAVTFAHVKRRCDPPAAMHNDRTATQ